MNSPGYLLSQAAQQDTVSIRDYTMDTWGEEQTSIYLAQLEKRLEWLATNPELGKKRDEVKEGYRSYPEGRHIIFYRISKSGIEIIGVIHQSEDVDAHLDQ